MAGRSLDSLSGPRSLPVVGNTHQLWRDPLAFTERCVREYGDVVPLQIGGREAVLLGHPDDVEYVLVDGFDNYEKGEFYREQFDLFDEGLLISDGQSWRQQRERVAPMFRPERIETYAETMVRYATDAAGRLQPNQPVSIDETMQRLALQIIAKALFSVDIEHTVPELREAITTVMETTRRRRRRPVTPPEWLPTPGSVRYDRAIETFDETIDGIIDDHRTRDQSPRDVISVLLAAREDGDNVISAQQIRDEVLTLLLAGHDTTALALGYVWYLLGRHTDVQATVVDEIDRVVGDRQPSVDDLPRLVHLERVIKEALRLYPPVYLLAREPLTDDTIGGYHVPSETVVLFSQWTIHRDSRFFEDPERFDPGRWDGESETSRHDFAYFPFSGGPRRCVGEQFAMREMQLLLAVFLQRYRFDLATEPPLALRPSFSLRPDSPIEVILRPRS
jgi:cytochrome P450